PAVRRPRREPGRPPAPKAGWRSQAPRHQTEDHGQPVPLAPPDTVQQYEQKTEPYGGQRPRPVAGGKDHSAAQTVIVGEARPLGWMPACAAGARSFFVKDDARRRVTEGEAAGAARDPVEFL